MQPKLITAACLMKPTGLRRLHAAELGLENRPELGQHKVDSGAAQMIVVAAEIGCSYFRFSASCTKLPNRGYIPRQSDPVNKRRRIYRVQYDRRASSLLQIVLVQS